VKFPQTVIRGVDTCRKDRESLQKYAAIAAEGRVVVFDTETTGIGKCDQIIEIAAIEYVRGKQTRRYSRYVRPTCAVCPAATAVNHLTNSFLEKNGISPTQALDEFFAFLGSDALLVAHNLKFDLRMLRNECTVFGYSADLQGVSFCDTLALSRHLVPGLPCYRLSHLIDVLGLEGENSHEAESDAIACATLFFSLMPRIA